MIEIRLVSHDVTKPRKLAAEDKTKIAVCGPLPISDPVPVPQKETNRLGSTLLSAASLFVASHLDALALLQALPPFFNPQPLQLLGLPTHLANGHVHSRHTKSDLLS